MKNCYQITHFSGRPTWKSAGGNAWHSCPESTPHECSVPNCPGDLNRRKLELLDEALEALKDLSESIEFPDKMHGSKLEQAEYILEKAKALK